MSTSNLDKVIFVLIEKNPTSYMREDDGSFLDTPLEKRVIHEYTASINGKNEKFRHIRNEVSAMVSKQDKNSIFVPKRDNLFFTNGVMVLDPNNDAVSIEFMKNHPYNEDYSAELRRDGIVPYFKELKPQEEGQSVVEDYIKESEAVALVMDLQSKQDDGTYKYNEEKINFFIRLFSLDSTLAYSEKIVALYKESKKSPQDFIYAVNKGFSEIEKIIDSAIKLKVISFDKKTAFINKDVMFVSAKNLNEDEMSKAILSYLISPSGTIHYEELPKLIEKQQSELVLKGEKVVQ
jgi:hypothetical protein